MLFMGFAKKVSNLLAKGAFYRAEMYCGNSSEMENPVVY